MGTGQPPESENAMTQNRRLQKAARDLMQRTGIKYTEALRQVQNSPSDEEFSAPSPTDAGPFGWHLPAGETMDDLLAPTPPVQFMQGSPGSGTIMLAIGLAQWQHAQGMAQVIVTSEPLTDYGFDRDKMISLSIGEDLKIGYSEGAVLEMVPGSIGAEAHGPLVRLYAIRAISQATEYTQKGLLESLGALGGSGFLEEVAKDEARALLSKIGSFVERTSGESNGLPAFREGHVLVLGLPHSDMADFALNTYLIDLFSDIAGSGWGQVPITLLGEDRLSMLYGWLGRFGRSRGLVVRAHGSTPPPSIFQATWVGMVRSPDDAAALESLAAERGGNVRLSRLSPGSYYRFSESGDAVPVHMSYG